MKPFLVALNLALLAAIIWTAGFWHPQADERPLPGTHAARVGSEAPAAVSPTTMQATTAGVMPATPARNAVPAPTAIVAPVTPVPPANVAVSAAVPSVPVIDGGGEWVDVVDAYVPLAPPGVRTHAAYLTLRNRGEREVRLVGAACAAASVTELHGHINDNGLLRMRQLPEVVVPPGGEAAFRPGGMHVMLIDMKKPLAEGDRLPISLQFADGRRQTVDALVRRAAP